MSAPPLVDYFHGMFQRDDSKETDAFFEMEATYFHEAAHAVIMYGFGQLVERVGVCQHSDDGWQTVVLGGEARPRGKARVVVDFPYRRSQFVHGCVAAAGPAGERRYRHEVGLPMNLLGATEGDHRGIETIAKALARRGRDRFAYQRMVWYSAQKLVAREDVWSAVAELADCFANADPDDEVDGTVWTYIEPRDVYWACRRNGIKRGSLLAA